MTVTLKQVRKKIKERKQECGISCDASLSLNLIVGKVKCNLEENLDMN